MPITSEVTGTAATGGADASATLSMAASAINSTFGVVAQIRRYANGSTTPTLDHTELSTAGWTQIGVAVQSTGTFRTAVYLYGRRGNGTFNSITVSNSMDPAVSTTNNTTVRLVVVPNVKDNVFWTTPDATNHFRATTNSTSLTATNLITAEPNSTVLVFAATGGTSGGFTVPADYNQQGGGSASTTIVSGHKDIAASGTNESVQVSWVTSGVASMGAVVLNTNLVTGVPVGDGTKSVTQRIDYTGMTNAVSMTATRISGPTVTVNISGLVATFTDVIGRTESIVIDFTISNGSGGTTVKRETFAPGSGATITKRVGTLIMGSDGSIR